MADKIQGDDFEGRITPQERIQYEKDYKQAASLFQKALEQHAQATDMYQRNEFQNVMDEMMQALNETASALKKEAKLAMQNKKIEKDYTEYQLNPDAAHKQKLQSDLENAKKSV